EEHGGKDDNCRRCSTAIAVGDPGGSRISESPLGPNKAAGWWRPQQADEYAPPACYQCQGLTRAICRNCHSPYCYEHKGPPGLCTVCGASARLGSYIFFGVLSALALFFLLNWLFGGR